MMRGAMLDSGLDCSESKIQHQLKNPLVLATAGWFISESNIVAVFVLFGCLLGSVDI